MLESTLKPDPIAGAEACIGIDFVILAGCIALENCVAQTQGH